ncbi:MAG: Gfo/Idh/MocA family protein, partial [Paracoccaceae bacterium]
MNSALRVACVGAGYFSQFHRGSWDRMADVELVAVADTNLEAASKTGYPAFADPEKMIAETQPDILDIITPPNVQAALVRTAISAGVQTIICQKPFCASLAEAEAVVQEAEVASASLIVHENFRFMPWYRFIKSQLEEGRVGQLQQVTFRMRPGDGQGPDAYLDRQPYFQNMPRFLVEETAVHWIDTFRYLLGDPQSVYADLCRLNPVISGEDAGYILFDHPNGVRAMFDGNRHLDHASDNQRRTMGEALFEGTKGVLSLNGDGSVHFRA